MAGEFYYVGAHGRGERDRASLFFKFDAPPSFCLYVQHEILFFCRYLLTTTLFWTPHVWDFLFCFLLRVPCGPSPSRHIHFSTQGPPYKREPPSLVGIKPVFNLDSTTSNSSSMLSSSHRFIVSHKRILRYFSTRFFKSINPGLCY